MGRSYLLRATPTYNFNLQVLWTKSTLRIDDLHINSLWKVQVTYQQSKERERLLPLPTLFTGSGHCIVASVFYRSSFREPWHPSNRSSWKCAVLAKEFPNVSQLPWFFAFVWQHVLHVEIVTWCFDKNISTVHICGKYMLTICIYTYYIYIYVHIYIYINILIIYMCFLIHQRTRGGAPTKKIFVTAQASPFPYTSIRILNMIWAWTA